MKKFILFVLCATVALASCQKIDEPVITPEQSSFKVSAVIADNSTKVTYEVTDDAVTPTWAEGDKILVYDGTGTAELTVESVGPDGVATFADGYTPAEGATTLHAVYYPGKTTEDFAEGELKVDLTDQNGAIDGTTPAIMCATATVSGNEVRFRFYNQTAIIGVKKFQVNPNEEIEYMSVKGLIAKGTIEVVNGTLSLVPATGTTDMTVKFDSAIKADSDGIYSTPIYFMALPTEAAQIGIAASSATFTHCNTTAVKVADIKAGQYYYLSKKLDTDDSHVARYSNDGGANWTYTTSLADAVKGIATTTEKADGKVELLKDDALKSQIKISGKKFTWNGNGHTVSFIGKYSEITDNKQGGIHIMSSSDVDFTDTKFVGPGTSSTATDRPFAVVSSTASFGKDVTISDFKNSRPYGGAIWCNNQSVVYLKDNLKITNCHNAPASSSYGGGAICSDGSIYVQDDVLISNCSSTFSGGAILSNYNNETSMLIMSGNACIENCEAANGGAVYLSNTKANITLSDNVLIKGCEASTAGGGIGTSASAVIEMKGNARITGCKALNGNGGAIRDNYTGGSVTVTDNAVIDNCSAKVQGGAIQHCGIITISGNATIDNCHSDKIGGAIAVWQKATLAGNATIKNCTSDLGGAICDTTKTDKYGVVIIQGSAKIDGCSASRGGGIYMASGEVGGSCTISDDATISNCKATSFGGGLLNSKGTVTMNGGTISGCSAQYGGGIDNRKTLKITGGTITGCTATSWGGGLYTTVNSTAAISFDDGLIEKCTGTYGAAVCMNTGSFTMNGGTIDQVGSYSAVSTGSNANAITITINGGTIKSAAGRAISLAKAKAVLNITGGTLISESTTSTNNAVYNNLSTVNISGNPKLSAVSNAIYSLAGTVNIQGGDIKAKNNYGINIVASGTNVISFSISGGTVTSAKGNASINFPATPQSGSTFSITGGLYSSVSDAMRTYLGSGYQFADNGDGYQKVVTL